MNPKSKNTECFYRIHRICIENVVLFVHTRRACLSIPEWEAVTKGLHEEATGTLKDSALLRSVIDEMVLKNSGKRLRDRADAVDIALARFVLDTQQVEKSIEIDLKQVNDRPYSLILIIISKKKK